MPMTSQSLNKAGIVFAAALVAMTLNPAVSSAKNTKEPTANPPGASQMKKHRAGGTGPGRPIAGMSKIRGNQGQSATADTGCHDGASQTSYEGSCDYHEQYQSTGGCESDTTGTSYPGNCRNSSEP